MTNNKRTSNSEADVSLVAKEIEQYLSDHPNAADTLDGIVTWWLARQRLIEAKSTVQDALNYLEETRVVRKSVSYTGNIVYKHFSSEPGEL